MAKVIKWAGPKQKKVPIEDREIKELEDVTQKVERTYTLNQKQKNIDNIKTKIAQFQKAVPVLEAELAKIKTTLGVK